MLVAPHLLIHHKDNHHLSQSSPTGSYLPSTSTRTSTNTASAPLKHTTTAMERKQEKSDNSNKKPTTKAYTKAKAKTPASSLSPSASSSSTSSSAAVGLIRDDEHALLAAFETRPTRPKRSSSERSKEFRAKRKKHETHLQGVVDALRRDVTELIMRRSVWHEKLVHLRHNRSDSLVKLVKEYYLVFQHGLASGSSSDHPRTKYQLDFVQRAMESNIQVGPNQFGIPVLLDQWKQLTLAYPNLFVELGQVSSFGPEEDRIVRLSTRIHVQFSSNTLEKMFPGETGSLDDLDGRPEPELVAKFLGKNVTYDCVAYFHFSENGKICYYDQSMGIVEGLLQTGGEINDVVALMRYCVWNTPHETMKQEEKQPREEREKEMKIEMEMKMESEELLTRPAQQEAAQARSWFPLAAVGGNNQKRERNESCSSDSDGSDSHKLSVNFLLS